MNANELSNLMKKMGKKDLGFAVEFEILESVKTLVEKGADIDKPDEFGDTPLMISCWCGFIPKTDFLLEKGAKIDHQNKFGRTSLMNACSQGHLPVLKLLLKEGVNNVNVQDRWGNTALIYACEGKYPSVVHYLLEKGADSSIKNNRGLTAWDVAQDDKTIEHLKDKVENLNPHI